MKNLFWTVILGVTVLPVIGYSQEEKLDVGPSVGVLSRTGTTVYGARFSYKSPDGLSVPVSVEFGKGLQKYTAGLGLNIPFSDMVSLSTAAALGNMHFNPESDLSDEKSMSVFTALLQQELRIQLSRNVVLGLHADFDFLNGVRVSQIDLHKNYPALLNRTHDYAGTDADGRPMWYSNYTGEKFYADYASEEEYSEALEGMRDNQRRKSMTTFGVSLKIDLFNGRNR